MEPAPIHNRLLISGVKALLLAITLCVITPIPAVHAEKSSPELVSKVVVDHGAQLAGIHSHASAMALFTTTIGPALGVNDVARILGAKGLSAQVAKDLGIAELSQSAQELMAALAAWQLADSTDRTTEETPSLSVPSPERQDWISGTSRLASLNGFFRLMAEHSAADPTQGGPHTRRTHLLLAAQRVALEAHQRALAAWWSLAEWKDRIRQSRGLARLCGTWQWIIHNHHNHQEQKMTIVFPPAGQTLPHVSVPAEAVVLGDSIYLRWEERGYVQEDSLLFVTEGHKKDALDEPMKLEGSFANNTGGWGPISAKRLAKCRP
jgi:hypothetical protein